MLNKKNKINNKLARYGLARPISVSTRFFNELNKADQQKGTSSKLQPDR